MAASGMSVSITGLDGILAKLTSDRLYRLAVSEATLTAAQRGEDVVTDAAPHDTGTLALSVDSVRAGKLGAKIVVRARAYKPSRKKPNYRYPKRLNYDERLRTFGWLDREKPRVAQIFQAELRDAVRMIEQVWRA